MLFYANDPEQGRIRATPRARAACPVCTTEVRAKCGKVTAWHWAHTARECDPFSEPMTAWHRDWQDVVPEACREVVLGPHRADIVSPLGVVVELQHSSIAVEEIQERETFYGSMLWVFDASDAYAAAARRAYDERRAGFLEAIMSNHPAANCGRPTCGWVRPINSTERDGEVYLCAYLATGARFSSPPEGRLDIRGRGKPDGYVTFRWKHPRKSLAFCSKPVFLDLGNDELLRIGRIHADAPCGGWGHIVPKSTFVDLINGRNPR